jgi:hypothetical protein
LVIVGLVTERLFIGSLAGLHRRRRSAAVIASLTDQFLHRRDARGDEVLLKTGLNRWPSSPWS